MCAVSKCKRVRACEWTRVGCVHVQTTLDGVWVMADAAAAATVAAAAFSGED